MPCSLLSIIIVPDGWFTIKEANKDQEASKDHEAIRESIADTAQLCDYPKDLIRKLFLKVHTVWLFIVLLHPHPPLSLSLYS